MELEFGCITWAGWKQANNGYGRFRVDGKQVMVHRWVYEMSSAEIPEGMTVDHLCFNRACIEPTHLRIVTRAENGRRHQPGCTCPAHWEDSVKASLEHDLACSCQICQGTAQPPLAFGKRLSQRPRGECVNGHDLTLDGALIFPPNRPKGRCRQCAIDADRRRQAKNKIQPPRRAFATAG